jgi:hypothetical protein
MAFRTYAQWRKVDGPEAVETLDALADIARLLGDLGRFADALGTWEHIAVVRRTTLGAEHPVTIAADAQVAAVRRVLSDEVGTDDLLRLYIRALHARGPAHLQTLGTLARLLGAEGEDLPDSASSAASGTGPVLAELPSHIDPDTISLDGDHADFFAELIPEAVELQDVLTWEHGPDHRRTLVATLALGHVLAAAGQFEGQADDALPLVADAREGLLDACAASGAPPEVLGLAESVHHWVLDLTGQDPVY